MLKLSWYNSETNGDSVILWNMFLKNLFAWLWVSSHEIVCSSTPIDDQPKGDDKKRSEFYAISTKNLCALKFYETL